MQARRIENDENASEYVERERAVILSASTLRHGEPPPPIEGKPEDKINVYGRVFGGTVASITVLILVTVYQSMAGTMRDLRSDHAKLQEVVNECARKDDVQQKAMKLWDRLLELKAVETGVGVAANRIAALEGQSAIADKERREAQTTLASLMAMKDKAAVLEEVRKTSDTDHKELQNLQASLASMKEKDAGLEKQLKDAETERKELCRELQALRERLAKFEGQHEGKPVPKPGDKPAS